MFAKRRDQDILNAMRLVKLAKSRMQQLRADGWVSFLQRVTSFCNKHGIDVPAMESNYVPYGRSTRFVQPQANEDHFRREVYIGIIDKISQELDNRFDEINMELLSCMSALHPSNSFAAFDAQKWYVDMLYRGQKKIYSLDHPGLKSWLRHWGEARHADHHREADR